MDYQFKPERLVFAYNMYNADVRQYLILDPGGEKPLAEVP
jgi:hypothetical protein